MDCPKEFGTPQKDHTRGGSWQHLWTYGEEFTLQQTRWPDLWPSKASTLEQFAPEGSTVEQFVKNCSAWEGFRLEKR